jgi:hypothetical protein
MYYTEQEMALPHHENGSSRNKSPASTAQNVTHTDLHRHKPRQGNVIPRCSVCSRWHKRESSALSVLFSFFFHTSPISSPTTTPHSTYDTARLLNPSTSEV